MVKIAPEAPIPILAVENKKYGLEPAADVAFKISQLSDHTEMVRSIGMDTLDECAKSLLSGKHHSVSSKIRKCDHRYQGRIPLICGEQ
jgi:bifunctional ADP-heptose synthase (sugar kinase/adenylyltransferase)